MGQSEEFAAEYAKSDRLLGPKGRYITAQVEGLGFVCFKHGLKGRVNCGNFSDSTFQALRIFGTYPGLRPGL